MLLCWKILNCNKYFINILSSVSEAGYVYWINGSPEQAGTIHWDYWECSISQCLGISDLLISLSQVHFNRHCYRKENIKNIMMGLAGLDLDKKETIQMAISAYRNRVLWYKWPQSNVYLFELLRKNTDNICVGHAKAVDYIDLLERYLFWSYEPFWWLGTF